MDAKEFLDATVDGEVRREDLAGIAEHIEAECVHLKGALARNDLEAIARHSREIAGWVDTIDELLVGCPSAVIDPGTEKELPW
jgi:hypothetical protein